jgi:hypothetical protein
MIISIVNFSAIPDAEVERALRAINRQIEGDFAPYWSMAALLRLEGRSTARPELQRPPDLRGDAIIYLWDELNIADALGYHDANNQGIPYGFVFTEIAREINEPWTVTLSHEALELIGDPSANVLAAGPHPSDPEKLVFHWYEMCDAVQAEHYPIDGVEVSNFVLPLYFTVDNEPGGRNDFLNRPAPGGPLRSFGIKPGGYVGFYDPEMGSHETFALASDRLAHQRLSVKSSAGMTRRSMRYRSLVTLPEREARRASLARPCSRGPLCERIEPPSAPAAEAAVSDLPRLDLEGIARLEEALDNDPKAALARIRKMRSGMTRDLTESDLRRLIELARVEVARPHLAAEFRRAAITLGLGDTRLPPEFTFEGMTPEIPIDPSNCQFEENRDALGWLVNAGLGWTGWSLDVVPKAPFRWAEDFPSRFTYPGSEGASGDTTLAIFSDFGTGLYHSRYIARHLESLSPRYGFHLGDVYYAGRRKELAEHFEAPLRSLLAATEVFALPGNHEMFSGGTWYFKYLDDKKALAGQRQEGSYFALRLGRFQAVGVDTDYHQHGRLHARLKGWLKERLEANAGADRINILLTSTEPYDLGSSKRTELYEQDLKDLAQAGLIDIWFWGNTHYGALYDRNEPALPFMGSCVGHGGYPYDRIEDAAGKIERSAAPVLFLEAESRFSGTSVRPDRGNNGFALLTLHHATGRLSLQYLDWRKRLRKTFTLAKVAGKLQVV